jgi:hypothetical protein
LPRRGFQEGLLPAGWIFNACYAQPHLITTPIGGQTTFVLHRDSRGIDFAVLRAGLSISARRR